MTEKTFARRELPAETLGEALRIVREEVGYTTADVAQRANVQQKYVEAIEVGRYDQTPGPTYVRGFLRSIATVLDLSPDAVLARFAEEPVVQPPRQRSMDEAAARTTPVITPTFSFRRLRLLAIGAAVALVVVIFSVQVFHVVAPPPLTVTAPASDLIVEQPQVELTGQTAPEVSVQVNGHDVAVDAQGGFTGTIDLQPGLNTLTVTAKRKSSRTATVIRRVLVQLPAVVQ